MLNRREYHKNTCKDFPEFFACRQNIERTLSRHTGYLGVHLAAIRPCVRGAGLLAAFN